MLYCALVTTAERTLDSIVPSTDVQAILRHFVPPERFERTTFESYQPDPRFPSQLRALNVVSDFATEPPPAPAPAGWRRWFGLGGNGSKPPGIRGLYLDGGYGVGKTHLLSAAYHAALGEKAYLTFQELTYTLVALGKVEAANAFRRYRLICLDEFELDDLGNTMLVGSLFRELSQGDVRIVTTSNTLPTDLGQGRFHAEDFKREIGEIAGVFTVVTIDGEDYRQRSHDDAVAPPGLLSPDALRAAYERYQPTEHAKVWTGFDELLATLARHHPIRFPQLVEPVEALFVDGLHPIQDQDMALRFVHFIDETYDHSRRLAVSAACPLGELFPASYREGGYKKKYGRCLSRLSELLHEAGAFLR